MKGGKGGMGRGGGKPSRGGKPGGKPGTGGKPGAASASKFAGKPKRGESKAGFGGRSSADDATRQERPARNTSRPPVAAARPPRVANAAPPAAPATTAAPTRGAVSVQRTLNVPASAVIRAINDSDRRAWSPEPLYRVMSVLAPRFIRVAFPDGSLAAFSVTRQGNARCTVAVELSKLPDGVDEKQLRDRWSYALAALEEQVDHSWD